MFVKAVSAMIATLIAVAAAACGGGPGGEPPAAVIAGDTLSRAELAGMLESVRGDSLRILDAVDNIVNSRLVVADAVARGLRDSADMQRYRYEREREQLQNAWLGWYLDSMVTLDADTVREFYAQMGTMVVFTVMNVQDSLLCDSLRTLVLAGTDMNDLVADFSSIPWDVQSQGRQGPIDLMRASTGDRLLLAGLSQGDVSPMEHFPSGWRFLKVDSTFAYTVEPYEDLRDYITDYILSHEMETYKQGMEDSLREANHLTVCPGIPELVVQHALDDTGAYSPYTPQQEAMPAYTFDGGSRSLISLVENIRSLPSPMPKSPTDAEWVEGYCNILGLYDIMAAEGRRQGMDTLPDIVSFVEESCTSHLFDLYYAQVIAPRIVSSEEELVAIYEENPGMFLVPETRTFRAVGAFDEEQTALLAELLASGIDPFTRLDDLSLLEGLTTPENPTITTPLSMDGVPSPWDTLLFSREIGESVVCTLGTDRVALLEVHEVFPEHEATFEESRGRIEQIFRTDREEEVISLLVDSLRSAYHYDVDMDFVRGFFAEVIPVGGDAGEPEPVPADSQTSG